MATKNPSAICQTALFFIFALCVSISTVTAQTSAAKSPPQPSAADLIKGLQSPNLADRERAAKAAAGIKPLPASVAPTLLNSLRGLESQPSNETVSDATREQWRYSADLVTALGNAGPAAIPDLRRALDDRDEAIRRGAVDALMEIARVSPSAWPVLVDALGNSHPDVPHRIEDTINANGNQVFNVKIVPLLQRSLGDPNPKVRGASAVTLSFVLQPNGGSYCSSYVADWPSIHPWANWTGPAPADVIVGVAKALDSVERDRLPQTLSNLCDVGPSAAVAIPYLLPLLNDREGPIRWNAMSDLAAIGPAACVAIRNVLPSLKDPDKGVRLKAMAVLGLCGSAAKDALPELAAALKSGDDETAQQAALALANIDPSHEGLLPILIPMLNNKDSFDPGPRQTAVQALGEMGSYARPAVPTLEHLIATDKDDDDSGDKASERRAQVNALVRIEGAAAIPELEHVMRTDKDDEVRIATVTALGGFGIANRRAVSALIEGLDNDSETVRDAASEALGKLGRPAVPALIAALKSPHIYQRAWAVQALGKIQPLPHNAEHALKLALNDKSQVVKTEAAAALKGDKVDAGASVEDKQLDEDFDIDDTDSTDNGEGQDLEAFVAGKAVADSRIYSKAEIVAPIPPDENHEYPSELKYFVPVAHTGGSGTDANFVVTVHAAQEGVDSLAVWKKIGDDRYQRVLFQQASSKNHFEKPQVFAAMVLVTGRGADRYEIALFLNLPLLRVWGDGEGIDDTVFVVDHDELRPVAIADAEEGSGLLHRHEGVWNGGLGNDFKDNDLEFGFIVWNDRDAHCCPTAGEVNGTYKVVKQVRYDAQKKDWTAKWKMVVDSAKREPIPKR